MISYPTATLPSFLVFTLSALFAYGFGLSTQPPLHEQEHVSLRTEAFLVVNLRKNIFSPR
ncbi:hypothetical protein V8D89_001965 [Ganoderma adspersum]